jgi:hypothetical protein
MYTSHHGYLDGKENNVRTFSFVLFTSVSSSEIRPWVARAFKGGIDFQSKSRKHTSILYANDDPLNQKINEKQIKILKKRHGL